jgi:uronate dehydrogenase
VIYGISDNRERFFSNEKAAHLGYKPQDSAEDYRAAVEAKCAPGDPFDPAIEFAGGFLCAMGHPDDEA